MAIPISEINVATKIIESFVNPTLLYGKIFSEEQSTRDKVKGNGIYLKAPNGKPTKLNEKQWLQVRTKAFKDWFGDWKKQYGLKS